MSPSLSPAQLPPVPPCAHFGHSPPAPPPSPALTHSSTLRKASGSFTTRKVPAEASCGQRHRRRGQPRARAAGSAEWPARPPPEAPRVPGPPPPWRRSPAERSRAEPSGASRPPPAGMRGAAPAQAGRSSRAGPAPPAPPRGAAPAPARCPRRAAPAAAAPALFIAALCFWEFVLIFVVVVVLFF